MDLSLFMGDLYNKLKQAITYESLISSQTRIEGLEEGH